MALGLTTTKTRFRADSTVNPDLTPTGITNFGKLKINNDLYVEVSNGVPYEYSPPNQSDTKVCELRNVFRPTWVLGANVALDSNDPKKSASASNSGAYYTGMASSCAIEGEVTTADKLCGISLQSGAIDYNTNGEHCLIFQADGTAVVYEQGNRLDYTFCNYEIGDVGLIDKNGDIIRYYLIRSGQAQLLRVTRSKLTDNDISGVLYLYHIDTKFNKAYLYSNESTNVEIETFGVLDNFQDWFVDYNIISTAEAVVAQDNTPYFSFPNSKKRIRSMAASRGVVEKTDRINFVSFFNYHGTEKEFIFVDKARRDVNDDAEWFWARFGSAFGDKVRSSCLSAETAQIIETNRKDIIPLEIPGGITFNGSPVLFGGQVVIDNSIELQDLAGYGANKFLGINNTADGMLWGNPAGLVRQDVNLTTTSLANGASATGTIALGKTFQCLHIVASHKCRISLYKTSALRTADNARAFGDISYLGKAHGIIADLQLMDTVDAPLDWPCSPDFIGSNGDDPVTVNIYYRVVNLSGSTNTISIDFTVLTNEA